VRIAALRGAAVAGLRGRGYGPRLARAGTRHLGGIILKRQVFVAVVAVAGAVLGVPPPVHAVAKRAVECGDVLVRNTTLTHDLACAGDALVAGANAIVIDLGGHTIDGVDWSASGIRIEGFDNIIVRNGTLTRLGTGIQVTAGANGIRLVGLNVLAEQAVEINRSNRARISGSVLEAGGYGLRAIHSHRNEVVDNLFPGGVGAGFEFVDSNENLIEGNYLTTANISNLAVAGHRNIIANNLSDAANAANIAVTGNDNVVRRNVTSHSSGSSVVVSGDRNRVEGNVADESWEGLRVAGRRSTVVANRAMHNVTDGIQVQDATVRVGGNIANTNGNLGIAAVASVVDLGGNRARNNGDPRQCVNVQCT
jgi:hypothetical protein